MTPREQTISETFERFRRARRLPDAELVATVVGMVLEASGADPLSRDEARYLEACTLAGWSLPFSQPEPSGCDAFDQIPDGERLVPMVAQPAKCTLWDDCKKQEQKP